MSSLERTLAEVLDRVHKYQVGCKEVREYAHELDILVDSLSDESMASQVKSTIKGLQEALRRLEAL